MSCVQSHSFNVFRKGLLVGNVPALSVTSYGRPMTKHQMARSIMFWDGPIRSGVRMQMINQFWRHLKRSRRERRRHGHKEMKQND